MRRIGPTHGIQVANLNIISFTPPEHDMFLSSSTYKVAWTKKVDLMLQLLQMQLLGKTSDTSVPTNALGAKGWAGHFLETTHEVDLS